MNADENAWPKEWCKENKNDVNLDKGSENVPNGWPSEWTPREERTTTSRRRTISWDSFEAETVRRSVRFEDETPKKISIFSKRKQSQWKMKTPKNSEITSNEEKKTLSSKKNDRY